MFCPEDDTCIWILQPTTFESRTWCNRYTIFVPEFIPYAVVNSLLKDTSIFSLDNISIMAQMMESVFDGSENIVGEAENAFTSIFSFSHYVYKSTSC